MLLSLSGIYITFMSRLILYYLSLQVIVKTLAAPVNPADINTIQGVYAVKPPLPMVPGNEGVGEVIATGDETTLKTGDRVIPRLNAIGTWSSHLLVDQDDLIKVLIYLKMFLIIFTYT